MILLGRKRLPSPLVVITGLATAVLASALSLAPAGASTHAARPHIHAGAAYGPVNICISASYCMRDPSSGGAGTNVVVSGESGSGAEQWTIYPDTRCSGGVITESCPGGFASNYVGDPLVVIANDGASGGTEADCIKANDDSSWDAVIGACDSSGTSEISSAYVELFEDCGFGSCFVSLKYGDENNVERELCSPQTNNQDVYVGQEGTDCEWYFPS